MPVQQESHKNPHRAQEADAIERMPFFGEIQMEHNPKTDTWKPVLTVKQQKLKERWVQIMDERKAKLLINKVNGRERRAWLNRPSARGIKTGVGDFHGEQRRKRETKEKNDGTV